MAHQKRVARSIVRAIQDCNDNERSKGSELTRKDRLAAFFALYQILLRKHRNDLFVQLHEVWRLDEQLYAQSFQKEDDLVAKGRIGYSGSVFFTTSNENYLVKSVPRRFEHSFFKEDFLGPYIYHMTHNLESILVRITDFLASAQPCLGTALGLAPSHHVIMENLLTGKEEVRDEEGKKWDTWDLKPTSYFFPERDIAGGKLSSEATKSRLADEFNEKIVLTKSQSEDFLALLEKDTTLLERTNAVDYSLFLVRIPVPKSSDPFADDATSDNPPTPPEHPPFAPPGPPTWRTGIKSADKKFIFRAAILDFFWAKHKTHAKFMTALIKTWNLIDKQGPMSITTTPQEYRQRFLDMCRGIVEIQADDSAFNGEANQA